MKSDWRLRVVLVVSLGIGGAGYAAADDSYGSIAFSPSTGANGYVWGADTKEDAEERALESCRKRAGDCITGINFWNSCGAVAKGDGKAWGAAWATSGERAQSLAMEYCSERARNCRVIRWQCSLDR